MNAGGTESGIYIRRIFRGIVVVRLVDPLDYCEPVSVDELNEVISITQSSSVSIMHTFASSFVPSRLIPPARELLLALGSAFFERPLRFDHGLFHLHPDPGQRSDEQAPAPHSEQVALEQRTRHQRNVDAHRGARRQGARRESRVEPDDRREGGGGAPRGGQREAGEGEGEGRARTAGKGRERGVEVEEKGVHGHGAQACLCEEAGPIGGEERGEDEREYAERARGRDEGCLVRVCTLCVVCWSWRACPGRSIARSGGGGGGGRQMGGSSSS